MAAVFDPNIAYGSEQPLPEKHTLHAGALTVTYEAGYLRNIRLGDVLIVQSIYAAVRDHNWGTVAGELREQIIEDHGDAFTIRFEMHHQQNGVHFVWDGRITGTADSRITFQFSGEARSTFQRNRVGFCVQHPMQVAGQACQIEHTDNTVTDGQFPDLIVPHQPYFDIRAISHEVVSGVTARVLMEGDTFEMEDQRNWTDASYKTYCTPLALPFPVTVEQGTRIEQAITVTLAGEVASIRSDQQGIIELEISEQVSALPAIGLGWLDTDLPMIALERLQQLHLSHLRVDVRLYEAGWSQTLERALSQAEAINATLEIAILVSDDAEHELTELAGKNLSAVVRWLIFHRDEKSTSAKWIRIARDTLDTDAPIGAGTDAFFTELNRERPPVDLIDFACYSLNPQVHAFDNDSLVETLPVQAETVHTAQAFTDGKPVVVSPITFKMRWNPNATGKQPPTPAGQLPPQVDTRQMSLFGAGWTLGSIKYLAESGAHALTYYQTVGWRGVMDYNNLLPERFPAIKGGVYPLYHVLADVQEFAGGEVVAVGSSQPLQVTALMLRHGKRHCLLLANHTSQTVHVMFDGTYKLRLLHSDNAHDALTKPDVFRSEYTPCEERLTLPPYAYARLNPVWGDA